MVLWEITLGTAYFLGLKRTYRLALRIQRRLISPNRPKIRQFIHRRTRAAFDVAINVHRSIQERDIEVGRNLGNWILRWLDKMKPSAQIRGELPAATKNVETTVTKQLMNSQHKATKNFPRINEVPKSQDFDRHFFTSAKNMWPKPFPTVAMMMRPAKPVGSNTQFRHLSFNNERIGFEGIIRKDIMQWMLQN